MTPEEIIAAAVAGDLSGYCSFYKPETGEIISVRLKREAGAVPEDLAFYDGDADPGRQYILDGELAPRPKLEAERAYKIVADGQAEVSFPLPSGTLVYFNGTVTEAATDESFVFTTTVPGVYVLRVHAPFPWNYSEVEVTAR